MIELRPFQEEGVRGIWLLHGRALLADEQGLGKTIQSLEWIRRIPRRRPAFIITPASLKYAWQAEAAHFGMRTEVLEGHRPKKKFSLPSDIVILNYDILHSWLPALLRADPKAIVFDEIHYLRNPEARRTIAAKKLAEGVPSVVGLSGTPMLKRPIELWSVLNIIKPDLYPDRMAYAWRFCKPRLTHWGWRYDGATNTEELRRTLLRHVMIRRVKKDVAPELPPKTRTMIPFRLKSYTEYQKAQVDFLKWLRGISPAKANRAKSNSALVKVGYILRLVARLKLEWTVQWIADFCENNPGEKLLALTMHTFVIDALRARFPNSVVVNGAVTGLKRQEAIKTFQTNPRVPLLFGNWIAAGVGLNLQVACNAVGLDFPHTPGALLQGEDRIHRIGQKRRVSIYYLFAKDTIEERYMKLMRKHIGTLDAILNGEESEEDFSMFDELLLEEKRYGQTSLFN